MIPPPWFGQWVVRITPCSGADREVEHLVDRAAAIADLEHLRLEPLPVALIARHEDVGEELHFFYLDAVALASLAAAARPR